MDDTTMTTLLGVIALLVALWGLGLVVSEHAEPEYYCAEKC